MPGFPQGHALVIGVGAYADQRWNVPTAARDAQGLAAALRDPAGAAYAPPSVELLLDAEATREGVAGALRRLANRARPDAVVLISFTCHGAAGTDGLYYLATSDAGFAEGERIVAGSGLAIVDLARALREIAARRLLLLVNACFAGHVGPRLSAGGIAPDPSPPGRGAMLPDEASSELVNSGEGRAIITAGRAGQRSFFRRDQPHSYFGQAMIDALRGAGVAGASGYISLFELYGAVHEQVVGAVGRQGDELQEPVLTLLQGVGAFPVASYRGATGSEALISQQRPGGAVREVPPVTVNVTNRRSVISFEGATIMGDVRTGHVVEGDLTIVGGERAYPDEDEPVDPQRRLPLLRARVEAARNVDVGDRDEAAAQLRLAEGSLARGDQPRARRQIEAALALLGPMNNGYVNGVVRKLEALAAALA